MKDMSDTGDTFQTLFRKKRGGEEEEEVKSKEGCFYI